MAKERKIINNLAFYKESFSNSQSKLPSSPLFSFASTSLRQDPLLGKDFPTSRQLFKSTTLVNSSSNNGPRFTHRQEGREGKSSTAPRTEKQYSQPKLSATGTKFRQNLVIDHRPAFAFSQQLERKLKQTSSTACETLTPNFLPVRMPQQVMDRMQRLSVNTEQVRDRLDKSTNTIHQEEKGLDFTHLSKTVQTPKHMKPKLDNFTKKKKIHLKKDQQVDPVTTAPTYQSINSLKSNQLFFCCECCRYVFKIQLQLHYPKCKQKPETYSIQAGEQRLSSIEHLLGCIGQMQHKHTIQSIRNDGYPRNLKYNIQSMRFLGVKDVKVALHVIYARFFQKH